MNSKQPFSEWSCSHQEQTTFDVLDYEKNKIMLSLCVKCQTISEFLKLLKYNGIKKNKKY